MKVSRLDKQELSHFPPQTPCKAKRLAGRSLASKNPIGSGQQESIKGVATLGARRSLPRLANKRRDLSLCSTIYQWVLDVLRNKNAHHAGTSAWPASWGPKPH